MPAKIFKQLNEKLQKEREETHEKLAQLYNSMPEPVDYAERLTTFSEALEALHNPDVEPIKKNALLKQCIERIDYKRERPELIKRAPGEKKGEKLKRGAQWTQPPIELDIKLRV